MAESARLRLLKGSVVIMGVLILLLAVVLVGELMRRAFFAGSPDSHVEIPALHAIEPGLPGGARVVDLVATEQYVVIHAILSDGETRLFVLDPEAASERPMEADVLQGQGTMTEPALAQ